MTITSPKKALSKDLPWSALAEPAGGILAVLYSSLKDAVIAVVRRLALPSCSTLTTCMKTQLVARSLAYRKLEQGTKGKNSASKARIAFTQSQQSAFLRYLGWLSTYLVSGPRVDSVDLSLCLSGLAERGSCGQSRGSSRHI